MLSRRESHFSSSTKRLCKNVDTVGLCPSIHGVCWTIPVNGVFFPPCAEADIARVRRWPLALPTEETERGEAAAAAAEEDELDNLRPRSSPLDLDGLAPNRLLADVEPEDLRLDFDGEADSGPRSSEPSISSDVRRVPEMGIAVGKDSSVDAVVDDELYETSEGR